MRIMIYNKKHNNHNISNASSIQDIIVKTDLFNGLQILQCIANYVYNRLF